MHRVLIVERELEFINAARGILESMGCEIEIALQGGTGVDIVNNRRIDAVIMGLDDLEIPGPELLQRIKEARPGIAILAASSQTGRYKMVGELTDRVNGFVDKPLDPEQLREMIGQASFA